MAILATTEFNNESSYNFGALDILAFTTTACIYTRIIIFNESGREDRKVQRKNSQYIYIRFPSACLLCRADIYTASKFKFPPVERATMHIVGLINLSRMYINTR